MEVSAVKTWFDVRKGAVVEVEDDVQNVIRDIKAIDDRLHVYWNEQAEYFDIVERCLDGRERLVFSVPLLDQRVPDRLRGADHWAGHETPNNFILPDDQDFVAQMEESNQELEKAQKDKFDGDMEYAAEALAWSLDICKDRSSVGGSILVPRNF